MGKVMKNSLIIRVLFFNSLLGQTKLSPTFLDTLVPIAVARDVKKTYNFLL